MKIKQKIARKAEKPVRIVKRTMRVVGVLTSLVVGTSMFWIGQDAMADMRAAEEREAFLVQQECMALNIYHEARTESSTGQRAVAWVTMNRVASKRFPNTVCDVVYQANKDANGKLIQGKCQFSWYCDGKDDTPTNTRDYERAEKIAEEVMIVYGFETDPTDGADHYHADYVKPYWAKSSKRLVQIDTHIFYGLY